jgi:hypothetical protein
MTDTTTTITTHSAAPKKIGPLKMALGHAIQELSALYLIEGACPDYPSGTMVLPEDHRKVDEFVRKIALINGRLLRAIGLEVRSQALCNIEMLWFSDSTFLETIDGWATDQIENAARAAEDELEDARSDAGDRRWDERRA